MNKKLKEVALHEKNTGSSEAQIALLTDKIENLSAHMKKFKKVWEKLKGIALPDSRFHLNFEEYIPDFKDSSEACNQIVKSKEYKKSKFLFITPDNCLTTTREQAIKDGKNIIVSTYGIYRGFILITKNMIYTDKKERNQ